MTEWFESWFDSEYYHILYKDRDFEEADGFVRKLFDYLQLKDSKRVLDLACGKGRHSRIINELGHKVIGVDLSENSINEANQFANDTLEFFTHDMREVFKENAFDLIVNLFTSFGYFENVSENERVLNNVRSSLKSNGLFVIDYLNPSYVRQNLIKESQKSIGGVDFKISKRIEEDLVIKNIRFKAEDQAFEFEERVRLFDHDDFLDMFRKYDFVVKENWGDYGLNPYELSSPRQIFLLTLER